MKPLDVKTKFYNAESDEVFLEAQVIISFNCFVHFSCPDSFLVHSYLWWVTYLHSMMQRNSPNSEHLELIHVQVQNITQTTITLDRVTLEPRYVFMTKKLTSSAICGIITVNFLCSHTFTVTSLAPAEEVGEGVVGRGHCLQVISFLLNWNLRLTFEVGDSWQYLFCLKPRPEHNNKSLKLVTAIGKLDMVSLLERRGGDFL